jgi:prepilin-type N-terminal cleavage/methylation domain-containing protein
VSARRGFSLLEVLVALTILQVGLLGVMGLFTLSANRLGHAVLVERAAAEVAVIADSLSGAAATRSGESVHGDWRITWQADEVGLVVRAALRARPAAGPVIEVDLP